MALDECLVQEVSDGLIAKSLMTEASGGSRVVKLGLYALVLAFLCDFNAMHYLL